MSEVIRKAVKQDSVNRVMDIVNDWESLNKSDFIEGLLHILSENQVKYVLKCLNYNTPLDKDVVDDEIEQLRSCAISGFYHEEVPQFRQGYPVHEVEELVTATDVTAYVSTIQRLSRTVEELKQRLNQGDINEA